MLTIVVGGAMPSSSPLLLLGRGADVGGELGAELGAVEIAADAGGVVAGSFVGTKDAAGCDAAPPADDDGAADGDDGATGGVTGVETFCSVLAQVSRTHCFMRLLSV